MPNARYEVGENEKHYFTADWKMVSKHITIEQDGAIVASGGQRYSPPFSKKFRFDVGSPEPHHVEITAGPFHPIELKVDGRLVHPLL